METGIGIAFIFLGCGGAIGLMMAGIGIGLYFESKGKALLKDKE